ncbi:polysaccharide biosynthesis C-terminal domain-containing protein [Streptomyces sp. NA04227]|uniref:lipid II flippase MurJ n=1 Tax=Streptomyces sp. NA04227 TaxID=2742136 RepID=UPI001591D403|nr:lipid II flippase MurJ [Streptomyces sp. NA04227]QKW07425.1 polysaccharide biosynthesis C-terminal domain-containing protein [Streptomyces sp. NA04227]
MTTAETPTVPATDALPRTGPTSSQAPKPAPAPQLPPNNRYLAKAALLTAALSAAGALLGLVRDQTLARLFGAGRGTDAFLVAWTVPELASTLLIEEGLAFALVPAFSVALARRARGDGTVNGIAATASSAQGEVSRGKGASVDPVRALVASSLPRLALWLSVAAGLTVLGAPLLVEVLAPGLDDPQLAVNCTRLTATSVLTFGLAGYCSAALRAHRSFLAPATIYVAYNIGIIGALFLLGGVLDVQAAAVGVAVGGLLMVLAQVPSLWRELRGGPGRRKPAVVPVEVLPPKRPAPVAVLEGEPESVRTGEPESVRGAGPEAPPQALTQARPVALSEAEAPPEVEPEPGRAAEPTPAPTAAPAPPAPPLVDPALIVTVLLFALTRQSQVFIERFWASGLSAGAISHLNYAQKICQLPMVLSLMLCTVTFPVVARAVADGDTEAARHRIERDLLLAASVVLLGAAAVLATAPQLVQLLFQRGAFTSADTAATAGVMRVYAAGLLGHTMVGALVRAYFSGGRRAWYPLVAMGAGALVTAVLGAFAVGPWGVRGIAAANAVGITLSAVLLLYGARRAVALRLGAVSATLLGPLLGAAVAAVAGLACARLVGPASPLLTLGLCLPLVTGVFLLVTGSFLGSSGATELRLPRLSQILPLHQLTSLGGLFGREKRRSALPAGARPRPSRPCRLRRRLRRLRPSRPSQRKDTHVR